MNKSSQDKQARNRQDRLAEQLRANLKKRKAVVRGRDDKDRAVSPETKPQDKTD